MHSSFQRSVGTSALLKGCEKGPIQGAVNVNSRRARQLAIFKTRREFAGLRQNFCCRAWGHFDHLGRYFGRAGIA